MDAWSRPPRAAAGAPGLHLPSRSVLDGVDFSWAELTPRPSAAASGDGAKLLGGRGAPTSSPLVMDPSILSSLPLDLSACSGGSDASSLLLSSSSPREASSEQQPQQLPQQRDARLTDQLGGEPGAGALHLLGHQLAAHLEGTDGDAEDAAASSSSGAGSRRASPRALPAGLDAAAAQMSVEEALRQAQEAERMIAHLNAVRSQVRAGLSVSSLLGWAM